MAERASRLLELEEGNVMELTCMPIGDEATGFGSETLSSDEDYRHVDDSETDCLLFLSEIGGERTLRATDASPLDEESRIRARIAQITPPSSVLREWASRPGNQPPSSWFDDDVDPFEADE